MEDVAQGVAEEVEAEHGEGDGEAGLVCSLSMAMELSVAQKHDLENLLNGELAILLTDAGVPAQPEVKQGNRRLDVLADVDGLRVVLEAETGFDKRTQAIKDADARFKQNLTTLAFAVCYPAGATVGSLASSQVQWLLRTAETVGQAAPSGDWSGGSVQQLAEAVMQAPNSVADADKAAQKLSDGLDAAVQGLSTPVRQALAKRLDLPRGKPTAQDDGYFTPAKRGMLVVAMAMLFHHRVHEHLPQLKPTGYQDDWPPLSAAECATEPQGTPQRFGDAWAAILEVDYKPVFETARVALFSLPTSPDTALAIYKLAKVIEGIASNLHGMRHDLLGRVFHRVLDTARYDGSFYTSTAAATLLAALAIREEDCDWSDVNAVANLRICDPACGTGTLLMAAADRIRTLRYSDGGPASEDDEAALALHLVEDVLWGYDINLTATHMAASALGMLSPKTQFGKMRIYRTHLGVYGGVPYLGSMEFLEGQARLIDWPQLSLQIDDDAGAQAPEQPPAMDLVIMNPPFTRSDIRHDQFSKEEERALKGRETAIFANHPHRHAVHMSGQSTPFCVLAEKLLGKGEGTLALVLPLMIPTAPSGQGLRQFLGEQFHVETIVSSHDPKRIYFSENTRIGEVLVVCRRWQSAEPKPPTRVINLAENPSTPIGSLTLANRIGQNTSGSYTTQEVSPERIRRGDWSAVNFFSPFLAEAYHSLVDEGSSPALIKMSDIAEVGPEGRRIRDAYIRSHTPTASGRRALWDHKTTVTQSMRGQTDAYIEPKAPKKGLANKYWEQRSRLLLAHRLWLPRARVCAVSLDQPTVGSRWTPCRPHDKNESTAKALAVYLNSSVGILSLLGGRDNRKPSYPQFSLDTLRSLRVPDFNKLSTDARDALATTYDCYRDDVLLPLPQMNEDPIRQQLDEAVTTALGLDAEWIAQVRQALSEEPSVTNRRFGT